MQGALDQFVSFVVLEQTSHRKRLRFAGLVAAFIAILVYQTQWLVLRPGLLVLLAGQAGVAVALFLRSGRLAKDLDRAKAGGLAEAAISAWFDGEELFVKRLALYENGCQLVGFAVLGYEFWLATRSQLLAFGIGLIYPATVYFGSTRGRSGKAIRQLKLQKEAVASGRGSASHHPGDDQ